MQHWLKITTVTDQASATRVWEILDLIGALAITMESAESSLNSKKVPRQSSIWERQAVSGLFDDDVDYLSITNLLKKITSPNTTINMTQIQDRDWISYSQERLRPLKIGQKLWICPTWCDSPAREDKTVWITPSCAFGTGHHPSTQLCLEQLTKLRLTGKNVLDWGCGSGILAITALKLGASQALGVDIDDQAIMVARRHAIQNHVSDKMLLYQPEDIPQSFHSQIIVSNILSEVLIQLASTIKRYLSDDGILLLSGILDHQTSGVIFAFGSDYDFKTVSQDGWTLIIVTRK